MNILVTGGAGYLGSHTIVELLANNHTVVAVDNFANSHPKVLDRIEQISGVKVPFYQLDLRDKPALQKVFTDHAIDGVIHFAGLKAVGESTEKPLLYYQINLGSTMTLLDVMKEANVTRLVFSSSATVYGSAPIPYSEQSPAGHDITNPYGRTKYIIEQLLSDVAAADSSQHFTALRYFNPIGAHPSGLIGDNPNGVPNNIMPYITQVAVGKRDKLTIFGGDYDTPDGTCKRDYIHVVDLARGHVAALTRSQPGFHFYNLGSGKGTSVLELVHAFEQAAGHSVPYQIGPRRAGDLPEFYADASLAEHELGWRTEKTILDCCRDAWHWQQQNPDGYGS